jgi:hypothetical protein
MIRRGLPIQLKFARRQPLAVVFDVIFAIGSWTK